jgi:hypothetical protein
MKKSFTYYGQNEEGNYEEEIFLPAKYEVCFRCEGHGKHSNPSIDEDGITESEMEEAGEEFRENYLNGVFDVKCSVCAGEKVISVFDDDHIEKYGSEEDKKHLKDYYNQIKEERQYRAMCRMEQMYGA